MIKVAAVMVVRDQADLLAVNIRYHAAQGVTEFRIVDNGSSDGTGAELRTMARRWNILWTTDNGGYHQSDLVTGLAAEAFRGGADWILPIDADEFWSAGRRCLVEALAASRQEAVESPVINFVQERGSRAAGAAALLTMTHRASPLQPYHLCRELIEAGRIGFVEMEYPTKWLPRASADLRIRAGAHGAIAKSIGSTVPAEIVCLHAPIQSREVLDARAEHGRRLMEAGYPPEHGWHNQRWHRLQAEGRLDDEWEANSARHGWLKVGERRLPLVFDPRLRNAVQPWISSGA